MADLCDAMDKAARDTLQLKESLRKRAGCHPELLPLIEARLQATKNYDSKEVKTITITKEGETNKSQRTGRYL